MQELRQSTQVLAVIGPVVAVANGYVPVTTLDLSTADEAELLKHNTSTVTSISAATFAAITSADGYYVLTLTTSLTDTLGMVTVAINDDSLCLPVKQTFMVLTPTAWDAKYTAAGSSGLAQGALTTGTLQSATGTTAVLAAATSYANDRLNGMTLVLTGGTGVGQARIITDYVDASDTASVDTWTTTPDNTTTYAVYPTPPVPATTVTNITGNVSGSVGSVTGDVNGDVLGSVSAVGTGGIVAASFAAGAINDAAVAADVTIASVTGAVGSVTAGVTLAANAITAAATAADFGTEIAAAVLAAAAADPIDANIEQINTVAITGNGGAQPFNV
jgi:hypothetical protein